MNLSMGTIIAFVLGCTVGNILFQLILHLKGREIKRRNEMTQTKNCCCEGKDCSACYSIEEYKLAERIYKTFAKETFIICPYSGEINSPFTCWIQKQLEQRTYYSSLIISDNKNENNI